MATSQDIQFGKKALALGFITTEQLATSMAHHKRQASLGQVMPLAQWLLQNEVLTPQHVRVIQDSLRYTATDATMAELPPTPLTSEVTQLPSSTSNHQETVATDHQETVATEAMLQLASDATVQLDDAAAYNNTNASYQHSSTGHAKRRDHATATGQTSAKFQRGKQLGRHRIGVRTPTPGPKMLRKISRHKNIVGVVVAIMISLLAGWLWLVPSNRPLKLDISHSKPKPLELAKLKLFGMLRGKHRTGVMAGPKIAQKPSKKWSYDLLGSYGSLPTVAEPFLFISCSSGFLYCLDCRTGKEVWKTNIGRQADATPLVVDKTVFVGSYDHSFYAVQAFTGNILWTFPTNGIVVASAVSDNRLVYFVSDDGLLYALTFDGKKVWQAGWPRHGPSIWNYSAPVLGNGQIFGGLNAKTFCSIESDSGNVVWQHTGRGKFSAAALADGVVYVCECDGQVCIALEAGTGKKLWNVMVPRQAHGPPAVADGIVYFGTYSEQFMDNTLYAIDAKTGATKWQYPYFGYMFGGPVIVENFLYLATSQLYALDKDSGDLQWEMDFPDHQDPKLHEPVLHKGVLYILVQKRLYAFE